MNFRFDLDDEVLERIRRVDPLLDPQARSDADQDTETALRALVPGLGRPEALHARRRLRVAVRTGLVGGIAAAAVLAGLGLASGDHSPLVRILPDSGAGIPAARAAMILREAGAALVYPPGTILEQDTISKWVAPDGSTGRREVHDWMSATPPYDWRQLSRESGRRVFEGEGADGHYSVYVPSENTIYRAAPPSYDLKPGPARHTALLTVPKARVNGCDGPLPASERGTVTLTITDDQAEALRRGTASVDYTGHPNGTVETEPQWGPVSGVVGSNPNVTSYAATLRWMIRQRGVTVEPNATLDGAPAVRITTNHGRLVYWAEPDSYRPLQLVDKVGARVTTTRFPIYRVLRGADATPKLLSLSAQHPDARVDEDGDDFERAMCRLGNPG